jgi:hypothetical protein
MSSFEFSFCAVVSGFYSQSFPGSIRPQQGQLMIFRSFLVFSYQMPFWRKKEDYLRRKGIVGVIASFSGVRIPSPAP